MSRPLVASKPMADKKKSQRDNGAAEFHRRVFAAHGNKCTYPRGCGERATDAAHVIARSKLGQHRYVCPEENGRPLCRKHHNEQESALWDFPAGVMRRAIAALNKVLKVKLVA